MLSTGDKAPLDIKVKNQNDNEVSLQDYVRKDYLVVYFYPKDDTSGCTKEACSFRDFNEDIETENATVVGISKDSVESHQKFIEKHDLNFDLLADTNQELNKAFGVWVEKNMFGNKYMGTQRSTFILDKDGEIVKVWEKAKPAKHGEDVLKYLKEN